MAPVSVGSHRASSARGRAVLAVWLLGLLGVVGAAAVGRLAEPGEPGSRTAVIAFDLSTSSATPDRAASTSDLPAPDLIVLANPSVAGVTVTSRELLVQGYLRVAAGSVQITLEARGNRVIDDATLTPVPTVAERPTVDERPTIDGRARFEARFGLPNPRPNGRMIVQVAAYDRDGRILDVIRRPFLVGPLLEG
jgi:hypothetical protein